MSAAAASRVLRVGRYVLLDTIGEGAFGRVKLAVNETNGNEYAVKILAKSDIVAHELTLQVRREIAVMKALRHPNIIHLHEVLTSSKHLYIVIELVTGGELFDLVANQGRLPEQTARRYFQQLVDAVAYCHSRRVYHRDLKPENLLLSEDGNTLKITDFGLSSIKRADTNDELLHTVTGSPHYIPPEVITQASRGYEGDKADAWAVGMILYGMLAGYLPFDDPDTSSLYRKIVHEKVQYPSHFNEAAIEILQELFHKDPKQRANMERVREFSWFLVDYQPKVVDDGAAARRRRKRTGSSTRRHRKALVTETDDQAHPETDTETEIESNDTAASDKESLPSHTQSQARPEAEKRQTMSSDMVAGATVAPNRSDVMRPTSLRASTAIMPILEKSRHDSLPASRVVRRPHGRFSRKHQDEDEDSASTAAIVTRVDSEPLRGNTRRRADRASETRSGLAAALRRPFWKKDRHKDATKSEEVASSSGVSDVSPLQLDRLTIEEPSSPSGSRSMNLLSKARGFASARNTRAARRTVPWEPETPPSQPLTSFPPLVPHSGTAFQNSSPISPDTPTSMPEGVLNILRDGVEDRMRTRVQQRLNRNLTRLPSRRSELRSSNTTVLSTPRASLDSSILGSSAFGTPQGSTENETPEPRSNQSARSSTITTRRQLSLQEQHVPTGATVTPTGVRCATPVPRPRSASPRQATPQLAKDTQRALARDELGESAAIIDETDDWEATNNDGKQELTENELGADELNEATFKGIVEAEPTPDETMETGTSIIFKPSTLQFVSEMCTGFEPKPPHPLCPSLQVGECVTFPVWAIDSFDVFEDVDGPVPVTMIAEDGTPQQSEPESNPTPTRKSSPSMKRTIFAPLNSALIHKLSMTTGEVPLEKTNSRMTNR